MSAEVLAVVDAERSLARALFRVLYDAGVSFESNTVIPMLTAAVRASGYMPLEPPVADEREALAMQYAREHGDSRTRTDFLAGYDAGVRHRGPITDEAVDAVARAIFSGYVGKTPGQFDKSTYAYDREKAEHVARRALEAAGAAPSSAPDFTARVNAAARLLCPQSTEERREPCDQCVGRTTAMMRAADRS